MGSLPPEIDQIIEIAKHAPSSHNTQPWTTRKDYDTLIIGYDEDRQLHIGDPNKKELFISLGCFIEALSLASLEYGYIAGHTFLSTKSSDVSCIKFKKTSHKNKEWAALIVARRSDRRHFKADKIPKATQNSILNISEGKASMLLTDRRKDIEFLSLQTSTATMKIMSNKDFRRELSTWVRNNWTRKYDGMPGYTQGIPGPVSLLAKKVIKNIPKVAKDQAVKDSKRILHSSAIGLIKTTNNSPESWINAGRVFLKSCLVALKHDVKSSAISASIIDKDTAKEIVKYFNLSSDTTIAAILRFGYVEGIPRKTPRLEIDQFEK